MKGLKWILILAIVVVVLAGAGVWVALVKFEWEKPTIQLIPDSKYVTQKLALKVEDQKSGVAEVRVEAAQQGRTITLLKEHFPKGTARVEKNLTMRPLPQGLKDGEAQIKIFAQDNK